MPDDPRMSIVRAIHPLGFPWKTFDPFLFCVHHADAYPRGNEAMGPDASLAGRRLGMDFELKDGWRMYHGDVVPGFPRHPHRGFETITVARSGFIDHADSLGATARFGRGDTQWMTAGAGIVHSEMFPLRNRDQDNPAELFQIWLNLPAEDKFVEPHFKMLWTEETPRPVHRDAQGRETTVEVFAGSVSIDGETFAAASPPPHSWAARPDAHVAVWTIRMQPGAEWTLPAGPSNVNRTLYFFRGALEIEGASIPLERAVQIEPNVPAKLRAGDVETEVLMLQGRPIGEPVAHHGPFVMNTHAELQDAMRDYQRTQFGGWPWPANAPVHPRDKGRFAIHADGTQEDRD